MSKKLVVVSAGLSQPSSTRLLADRLTEAALGELDLRGASVDLEVIELRDLAQDITNNLLTGFASPRLQSALDAVSRADGLIAVTPIFTASYSGLFKSFFDVIDNAALTGLPVLIAATGGTSRHSLALDHAVRPLFSYLRAIVLPTAVFAASEDWGGGADVTGTASLPDRIRRAGRELAAQVAVSTRSEEFVDPFALDASFDPSGMFPAR
ncbi:FMN reductase [Herbiconiux sp. VKM Ac-1786]|uniref:FMN reductase n=1 Tax=Herbiconiux sp. VKM Ac-1786 TaxID=2783824 RepID=UPI00188D40F6|nr:FMN reductase [Herbiconiux sp. VKM Ac-1786]MBF4573751.1 FMN reductase [Herbiconiux sp. VKM Ac-1786]